MALSETEYQTFFDRGVVKIKSAFSERDAALMVDKIWSLLESDHGMRRDSQETWNLKQATGFQSLTKAGIFNPIATPKIADILDDLLGHGEWKPATAWGAPLVTFPEQTTWDVPRAQWHLDFPALGKSNVLPGLRVLAFIAEVRPRSGGTVVAEGTHRLVEGLVAAGQVPGGHSAAVRDVLAANYSWLRGLWTQTSDQPNRIDTYTQQGCMIDGVNIRVSELTGEAGDVMFMHPWTFHAPAPNCSSVPRLMVSHSVYRNC
jgi:hypothetical protein